ncbi:MAG: leucine-rich repeat domain-containing protein [Candidatus Woesearchaeota archaeon]
MTELWANIKDIRSLEGIEHLVNLKKLYLSHNKIEDLSPLSKLEKLKVRILML